MNDVLHTRLERIRPLALAVCQRLQEQVLALGLDAAQTPISPLDTARFHLERDPASGADSLLGEWRDARGQRLGSLVFHADGSFFVEHDVVKVHPRKPAWFVEAVTAWGRGDEIRGEPRLLPMPP